MTQATPDTPAAEATGDAPAGVAGAGNGGGPADGATGGAAAARALSPYVGLSFYTEADAEWFFGRDRESQTIIANLRAARLTILYAQSGVGKSSLLRAGVAHQIGELARRRRAARGAAGMLPVVFSAFKDNPVEDLIDAIAVAVGRFLGGDAPVTLPRDGLPRAIETAATMVDARLLIILDQFEEYFLYATNEPVPLRLADELARSVNDPELRANFLIAIREDAYAGLGDLFAGRIANVYGNHLALEYLDRDAARAAIVQPLEHFNELHAGESPFAIEPQLIDAVLDEVRTGEVLGGDAGSAGHARHEIETPYLQLVMSTLWAREQRDGSRELRLGTLRELGGAQEIVRTHLDGALCALSAQERATAVDVFQYLVTPSGTKIAYAASDLAELVGRPRGQIAGLLAGLSQGTTRILRHVPPPAGRTQPDDRYEIFHDVLAAPIRDWRARQISERLQRERSDAEDEARRERARARTFRALLTGSIVLLVAAIGLVVFALIERHQAVAQKHEAIAQQRAAVGARTTAQSLLLATDAENNLQIDPSRSTLLALQALRERDTPLAGQALRDSLASLQTLEVFDVGATEVNRAAFDAAGTSLVTADGNGTARIYDARSGALLQTLGLRGSAAIDDAQFSADGREVVTGAADGTVTIYDARTGRVLATPSLRSGTSAVSSVQFSPNGSRVLVASGSGAARIYDARTGARQLALASGGGAGGRVSGSAEFNPDAALLTLAEPGNQRLAGAAFSPNGSLIVTGYSDGSVRLWSAPTGALVRTLQASRGGVDGVAFSPDGSELVAAGYDGSASVFDVSSGRRVALLQGLSGDAFISAAFSPDGSRIVTADEDGVAQIWDAHTGTLLTSFQEPTGVSLASAAFSPNGSEIVTASGDGTARIWDADTIERAVLPAPGHAGVVGAAFSPNGGQVATASVDGAAAWIYDAHTGVLLHVLREPGGKGIDGVRYSPNGAQIVTSSDADGTARVWDARTGTLLVTLLPYAGTTAAGGPSSPSGGQPIVDDAEFSPDGAEVVTADFNGTAQIFDARTGARLRTLREPARAGLNSASFSPDGAEIVTASQDGTVRVWNAGTGAMLRHFSEPGGAVNGVTDAVFSPDGKRILAASGDHGMAWVLDARTGTVLATFQVPGTDEFVNAAFSPDGSKIVTASFNGVGPGGSVLFATASGGAARIWNAATGELLTTDDEPNGGGIVTAMFNRSGSQIVTASLDGTARIWSTELTEQLPRLERLARTLVPRSLTPQERREYLAGIGG